MQDPTAPIATGDQSGAYGQLRSAVLGSQQLGSPTSPLGSFPELAKLYGSSFQLPLSNAGTKATSANADVAVNNQKVDLQNKAAQLQAMSDASKYQQVKAQDGGFQFFDPLGNPISAYQYANATNKSPSEVLKNSENPIDKSYQQDANQLQSYINDKIASKSDPTAADKASAIEAQVKQQYGINLGAMKIEDVINTFKAAYPTVYGGTNTGVSSGQTLIPSASAVGA